MTSPKRERWTLGVMGGTFDPIHLGHLFVAEEARHRFQLNQVLFVPSKDPPHKARRRDISSPELRFAMALIAASTHPQFAVSRVELDREGPSYVYDTLAFLKKESPGAKLFFITGLDAILEILTWYRAKEVMRLAEFIAAARPGFDRAEVAERLKGFAHRVHFMENPTLQISSSEIRRRVAEQQPIRYLVPDGVAQYIYKNRLYQVPAQLSKKRRG